MCWIDKFWWITERKVHVKGVIQIATALDSRLQFMKRKIVLICA